MSFALDPHLHADTYLIGPLSLCTVLLMNDARYPWLILVPQHEGLAEITDLSASEAMQLMQELRHAARAMQRVFSPFKINIGALGNQVRQLHVHVIARFTEDAAWPHPVWGRGERQLYSPEDAAKRIALLKAAFKECS